MDAHPQATTHQSSRSPASMPPTQPGRRSRRGRLPRPKSWSNTIYLLLLIAVVAIELYPVLVSLYNAVTNGSELYWLFFQIELRMRAITLGSLAVLLLALGGSTFVSILLHESGHVLASWSVGYWLYQCKIGPLVFTRAPRGFHLSLTRAERSRGHVIADPSDWQHVRLRRAIFLGGGPLISLLWVGVSAWLCSLAWATTCEGLPVVNCYLQGLGGWITANPSNLLPWLISFLNLNLLQAVLILGYSLVPTTLQGRPTDALSLLRDLRGGPQLEHDLLFSCLLSLSRRGVRPCAWSADVAERLRALLQAFPDDVFLLVCAYTLALDEGKIQEAGALLDRAALTMVEAKEEYPTLPMEIAFFEAWYRGNLAAARTWLATAAPPSEASLLRDLLRPRAEAAIYLLEGRLDEAQRSISTALAALARFKAARLEDVQMEEENLQAMLTEAQQRQAAPPPGNSSPAPA